MAEKIPQLLESQSGPGRGPGRPWGRMFPPRGCRNGFPREPGPPPWWDGPQPGPHPGPEDTWDEPPWNEPPWDEPPWDEPPWNEPPWEHQHRRHRHRRCPPRGSRPFPGSGDAPWKEEERWGPHYCPPPPPWGDREEFQGPEDGFGDSWHLDVFPDSWPGFPEEEQPPPWPPAGPPRNPGAFPEHRPPWSHHPAGRRRLRRSHHRQLTVVPRAWCPPAPRGHKQHSKPSPAVSNTSQPAAKKEPQPPDPAQPPAPLQGAAETPEQPQDVPVGTGNVLEPPSPAGSPLESPAADAGAAEPPVGDSPAARGAPTSGAAWITGLIGCWNISLLSPPALPLSTSLSLCQAWNFSRLFFLWHFLWVLAPCPSHPGIDVCPHASVSPQVELEAGQTPVGDQDQDPCALGTDPTPPEETSSCPEIQEHLEVEPCSPGVPKAGTAHGSHPQSPAAPPHPARRELLESSSSGEAGAELSPHSWEQPPRGAGEAEAEAAQNGPLQSPQPPKNPQVPPASAAEPEVQPSQASPGACTTPETSAGPQHPPGSGETKPAVSGQQQHCSTLPTPFPAGVDLRSATVLAKKAEIEQSYQQFSLTIAVVATMLLQKEPSMEAALGLALRANLRQCRLYHLQQLEEFIDTIDSATASL
ncbi:basic salivary proline-rich protein 1-like isoform X2 [Parus major]|uniref:basic salivary proline-rich protein 1-like isoform X2 n=1 Tax=Parus major TaxID=9157 RepID=UPI0007711FD1|nr:basic salivary proline-rich protein 1-like isoform X2 [Parus major]